MKFSLQLFLLLPIWVVLIFIASPITTRFQNDDNLVSSLLGPRRMCNGLIPSKTTFMTPPYIPIVTSQTYTIGVIMYYNTVFSPPSVELARDDVNALPYFVANNISIRLQMMPDTCSRNEIISFETLIMEGNAIGIVGPHCAPGVVAGEVLSEFYQVPMISSTATASFLGDKSLYPYFMRTVPTQIPLLLSMLKLVLSFGWTHINFITSNDAFGLDASSIVKSNAPLLGISIDTLIIYNALDGTNNPGKISQALVPLLASNVKIFIYWSFIIKDGIEVTQFGASNHLFDAGNVWMGSEIFYSLMTSYTNPGKEQLGSLFSNWIFLLRDYSPVLSSPIYQRYVNNMYNATGIVFSTDAYALINPMMYDSVMAYGHSIEFLLTQGLDPNNGTLLLSAMRTIRFNGTSGPFALNSNGDTLGFPVIAVSVLPGTLNVTNLNHVVLGSSTTGASITLTPPWNGRILQTPTFPGYALGDNTIPGDIVGIVAISRQSFIVILAFACSALGTWSSLIIIEQAIYDFKQAVINGKRSDKSLSLFSCLLQCHRKLTLLFLLSLLLTSSSMSICGMWSSLLINQYQMTLSNGVYLQFYAEEAVLSILPMTLCIMIAFMMMIMERERQKLSSAGDEIENGLESLFLPSSTSINSNSNSDNNGENTFRSQNETTAPIHERSFLLKRRKINLDNPLDILMEVVSHVSWVSVVASLLFTTGILIFHIMFLDSAYVNYGTISFHSDSYSLSLLILSSFLCFAGVFVSLHFYVYLLRFRPLAALMMSATIIGTNQLCLLAMKVQYNAVDTSLNHVSSSYWSSTILLIIAVSIAAVSSLLFLFLQFNRMKLSRNENFFEKRKLQGKIEKMQKRHEQDQTMLNDIEMEKLNLKIMMEAIACIRPCHSPVAAALTLLQHALTNQESNKSRQFQKQDFSEDSNKTTGLSASPRSSTESGENEMKESDVLNMTNPDDKSSRKIIPLINWLSSPPEEGTVPDWDPSSRFVQSMKDLQGPLPKTTFLHFPYKPEDTMFNDYMLKCILHHPITLELFKDNCSVGHTSENVQFYVQCERAKKESNKEVRRQYIQYIMTEYVKDGSENQVNLSSSMRNRIIKENKARPSDASVLSDGQREVLGLIRDGPYDIFIASKLYPIAVLILIHIPYQSTKSLKISSPMSFYTSVESKQESHQDDQKEESVKVNNRKVYPNPIVIPILTT